jgi:hypothetical protein
MNLEKGYKNKAVWLSAEELNELNAFKAQLSTPLRKASMSLAIRVCVVSTLQRLREGDELLKGLIVNGGENAGMGGAN